MKNYRLSVFAAAIVIALMLLISFQAISSMSQESPTFDEVILLPAGYSYWKTGDYRLDFDSPPLIKLIASVPLLFMNLPLGTRGFDSWEQANELIFGHGFLYHQNADRIVFWGRIPIILLSLMLAFFVFKWARELYGLWAGIFALFLYSFEPNILAHSRLVTTDLGVSAFSTIAIYFFYRFHKQPNAKNLVLSGLTFGLALASKFSAVVLIPIYVVLSLFRVLSGREGSSSLQFLLGGNTLGRKLLGEIASFALISVIGLSVIFLTYGAKVSPIYSLSAHGGKHPEVLEKMWPGESWMKGASYFLLEKVPVPAGGWFRGLFSQIRHAGGGARGFLAGQYSQTGWWYYYLVAFFLKTPVPLLTMIFLAILLYGKTEQNRWMDELYLLVPILVAFGVSFFNQLAIGLRYVLPTYPLLFIFVSRLATVKISRKTLGAAVLAVLSLWFLYSSLSIYPHYLAYFNEFAGGPENGYRYLVDSNLDWGQDLKNLKIYMEGKKIGRIKLAYFGTANPDYYGIPHDRVTEEEMHRYSPGVYAISATELQNALSDDKTRFSWIKKYEPEAKIGYSIFVYDIK